MQGICRIPSMYMHEMRWAPQARFTTGSRRSMVFKSVTGDVSDAVTS